MDVACNFGEHVPPRVSKYTYLGVYFTGAWDVHIKNVVKGKL